MNFDGMNLPPDCIPSPAPPREYKPAHKLALYRAGNYLMPAPSGPTSRWLESDWIRFIDMEGVWGNPDDLPPEEQGHEPTDCPDGS